jgi:hypothetical protein
VSRLSSSRACGLAAVPLLLLLAFGAASLVRESDVEAPAGPVAMPTPAHANDRPAAVAGTAATPTHNLVSTRHRAAAVEPSVRITVRLEEVSPRLASLLRVVLLPVDAHPIVADRVLPEGTPDADNCVPFETIAGERRIGVRAGAGWRPLVHGADGNVVCTLVDGARFDVRPIEPFVGIVVHANGEPIASTLCVDAPALPANARNPAQMAHLGTPSALSAATEIHAWTAAHGCRSLPRSSLRIDGDVAAFDVERASAAARLTVQVAVPEALAGALRILAIPDAKGGKPFELPAPNFSADLPAGTYHLAWSVGYGPGPTIDSQLHLSAGEHRCLSAVVPQVSWWTAYLDGRELLGPLGARARMQLAGHCSAGFIDAVAGSSPIALPAAPRVGDAAQLDCYLMKMTLPARCTEVDNAARSFRVAPDVPGLATTFVRSSGIGDGARAIQLASLLPTTRFPAHLGADGVVPLAPGMQRNGCLTETIDGAVQVVCWFTLAHERERLLAPRGAWTSLRVDRAPAGATVSVAAFDDLPPVSIGHLRSAGVLPIYLAEGTKDVIVERPGQPAVRLDATATVLVVE